MQGATSSHAGSPAEISGWTTNKAIMMNVSSSTATVTEDGNKDASVTFVDNAGQVPLNTVAKGEIGTGSPDDNRQHNQLAVIEDSQMDVCEANGVGARRRPVGLLDLQIGSSSCGTQHFAAPQPVSITISADHTQLFSAPASARAVELAALVSPSVIGALSASIYQQSFSPRRSPATTPNASILLAIRG